MEIVIASIALLVSIASSMWTFRQNRELTRVARLANLASIVGTRKAGCNPPCDCWTGTG